MGEPPRGRREPGWGVWDRGCGSCPAKGPAPVAPGWAGQGGGDLERRRQIRSRGGSRAPFPRGIPAPFPWGIPAGDPQSSVMFAGEGAGPAGRGSPRAEPLSRLPPWRTPSPGVPRWPGMGVLPLTLWASRAAGAGEHRAAAGAGPALRPGLPTGSAAAGTWNFCSEELKYLCNLHPELPGVTLEPP